MSGIQSVNPRRALEMTFYSIQPADIRASGADVFNLNNEESARSKV